MTMNDDGKYNDQNGGSAQKSIPLAHKLRMNRPGGFTRGRELHPAAEIPIDKRVAPKVFVPHDRKAGLPPRKIEVERKKRHFAKQNIASLLRAEGVDFSLPNAGQNSNVKLTKESNGPGMPSFAHMLPLDAFDNTEYEERSPEAWMALGLNDNGEQVGMPVKALKLTRQDDGTEVGTWEPATAVAYNLVKRSFTVQWSNSNHDGSESKRSGLNARNQTFKSPNTASAPTSELQRLFVCFAAENPFNFAKRVGEAFRARAAAEQKLRYNLYIDCMPIDDVPSLDSEQISRIISAATSTRSLRTVSVKTSALLGEVNLDYQRTLNKILFDVSLEDKQNASLLPLVRPPSNAGPAFTNTSTFARRVPEQGVVPIPPHNLSDTFSNFGFHTHYTVSEIVTAMVKISNENIRIRDMAACAAIPHDAAGVLPYDVAVTKEKSLKQWRCHPSTVGHTVLNSITAQASGSFLQFGSSKSLKLDDFEHAQSQSTSAFSSMLREQWVGNVRNILRQHLSNLGKGWYNLRETSKEIYDFSKLKKLLTMINFRMQDALRSAVIDALHSYVDYMVVAAEGKLIINSPSDVSVDYSETITGDPDARSRRTPLFSIELMIAEREKTDDEIANDAKNNVSTQSEGKKEDSKESEKRKRIDNSQQRTTQGRRQSISLGPQSNDTVLHFDYHIPVERYLAAPSKAFEQSLLSLRGLVTVERKLMERLFWSHDPVLGAVYAEESWVKTLKSRLEDGIQRFRGIMSEYLNTYKQYEEFLNLNLDNFVQQLSEKMEAAFSLNALKTLVRTHLQQASEVASSIPRTVDLGFFSVGCGEVRNRLIAKHEELSQRVLKFIASHASSVSTEIIQSFRAMDRQLSVFPKDIEQLTEIKEYMKTVPEKTRELQKKIDTNASVYALLQEFRFSLDKDKADLQWQAASGPKSIAERMKAVTETLETEKTRYLQEMTSAQEDFEETLNELHGEVLNLGSYTELDKVNEVASHVATLKKQIEDAKEKAALFNTREGLFGKTVTEYERLSEISKNFEPYCTLWETVSSWIKSHRSWTSDPFLSLDAEAMEKQHAAAQKNMHRSVKAFEKLGVRGCLDIAQTIKQRVEDFKQSIPLVQGLRNPGMRDRHWGQLSEAVGFTVAPDEKFTLMDVYSLGLQDHLDTITKVGERAGKEYHIEQALDKMEGEWQGVKLDVVSYRNTGTYILRGVDDLQALLDEHITMTSAMAFSAFKKPFAERIDKWQATLNTVSDVLDEWIKVQRSWLYLQPIFDSADIQKQLPKEYKRFSTVDRNWRATLNNARANPKAIKFCANAKLLEKFQESNTFLELVQKELSDYLETKRAAFARFYFLSNDELLDILSSTKDPRAVQAHLKKCFEGLNKVEFTDDLLIVKLLSEQGEVIDCVEPVDPKNKNVEVWMNEVEAQMRTSVKHVLWRSIVDYKKRPRTSWIQSWPAQCVLNGSQLHWTREIEEGIREAGTDGVQACYDRILQQLQDIVKLVRGKLDKLIRVQIGALTVVDVHARDVTRKLLESGVSTLNDFDWISQMRYNWTDGELEGDMRVRMLSADRPYGYEYLGNTGRLVITPLTDKCYLTLMGAVQMNLGGAPAGPAGTGKTETTKDLAKAIARQCVVFNCSDGLDYLAMGKFFKGLAACGAWACFDEFNRIDVEVLSVVAQQLMTLQNAVNNGLHRIMFGDSEIRVDPQYGAFITMNPGYAGRTELPDNLKALFRPVAMMVPDYALIAEIMLFSFGFDKALACARKMVATFKLCSEQLSSQDHYDYGMRAVNTVIKAAGNLKRQNPDMDEEVLLYRALQDVNLPKFLAHDIPLFRGIMSDLFPGISRPNIDYGDLMQCLTYCTEQRGLQPVPIFLTKCIQLYETIVVRHGLMVVGPTGGGKSCIINVLSDALTLMASHSLNNASAKIEKVQKYYVNPKSITMGQLYGEFDENTHEWQDGILAGLVRKCADSTSDDLKWMIFDGPVDALWIENMNTVLDDNKKLCLVSGEIIKLSSTMEIMFEVEDLAVASPATVSRCGMVYTEPHSLGLDPLVQSWLEALPEFVTSSMKATLHLLFDLYVHGVLQYMRRYLNEPVPTVDNQLLRSLLNLLDCELEPLKHKEGRDPPTKEQLRALEEQLPALFMFALVWSMGASVDASGRERLDTYLRGAMDQFDFKFPFPTDGYVYDYCWQAPNTRFDVFSHNNSLETTAEDDENGQKSSGSGVLRGRWVHWLDTVDDYQFPTKPSFAELIIPTKDTVRYTSIARSLLQNRKYTLMTGPTGTGKTVNIMELLSKGMSESYVPLNLTFSAQTSANQTQDLIDSKCEKRQRGIYGPTVGTYYVLFVDDFNMPQREKYFAQPPIELLRQWCDYGGWYDRKERTFRRIVDTILVAAMGPPGGGRNPVTPRMIRHFNLLNYTPMDNSSMYKIFYTILNNFLAGFSPVISKLSDPIVNATIDAYNTIVTQLLPTPTKPHYMFNLRDLGKVFQGLLMANPSKMEEGNEFIRLWIHECRRVFQDRLVSSEDRQWFDTLLETGMTKHMNVDSLQNAGVGERLIFGDYMIPGADPKTYEEVRDMDKLVPTIEEYLQDFNAESRTPMKLVMFLDAIEHVSRISRVLRQPQGNALLLGVGGSGRQSLSRLATFMADYSLFQVEVSKGYGRNEWREDLKNCLMKAGVEQKQIVFLFTDTQIVFEGMVEDINSILNSGDVPNLYAVEDMDTIIQACRRECMTRRIPPTKINIYAQYLMRVRANIHVIFCMSPMGEPFRDRLRMFPALVNCCTIDWFSEWPEEALRSVAQNALDEGDLQLDKHIAPCVEFFRGVHQSVANASKVYYDTLRRYNYVTPTSYLELLSTFKTVLSSKREEVDTLRNRLQVGLDKLISTQEIVAQLQEELTEMQPQLKTTQAEVEEMIVQIDKDKEAAAETKVIVEKEESEASEMAAETKAIADDAQRDLDAALPALDQAVKCLRDLKKSDIDELRSMNIAPKGVVLTMHAACLMFGIKPVIKKDPASMGKKTKDYWEAAKGSLLKDANKFLKDLLDYDKDSIPESTIQEIEPFISNPDFTYEAVEKASKACSGVCMWVRAMYKYHTIAKQVEPKKRKLAEAQAKLDETMAKLNEAKQRLKDTEDKIAELQQKFDDANNRKDELANQVAQCQARLSRAEKLIGGLGGEKDRWTETIAKLSVDYKHLVGDALISSATIAYLGAFTSEFRQRLVTAWQEDLIRLELPHTPGCNVRQTLADPVRIRGWNIAGLPSDNHSVENGIIMWNARRWPLLIDPQGQANRYIKNMGRDKENAPNDMDVVRLNDKKFLQSLENGIRFGKWVLLENVAETLDATIEPVLQQQKFKQGGTEMIKLGDSVIPYNNDFRFFITTKLPNPHYPPEVAVKVSLLNFTITPQGLEDQMLGVFVVNELPELEERKNTLTLDNARMRRELKDIESKILHLLSTSTGNILDDEELINTLSKSKVTSEDIKTQVKAAEETEKEIDATREKYRPVAFRASILYFCISDLSTVDPMYQYSLPWFTNLFINGIRNSEPAEAVNERIGSLNSFFSQLIYRNVCRSLFERHKLLFSFLMTIRILQGDGKIDHAEWQFLISGRSSGAPSDAPENPQPTWVTAQMWTELCTLAGVPFFSGLDKTFDSDADGFKRIFDANESHKIPLPSRWEERDPIMLQRMCLLRCLRPDRMTLAIQDFVQSQLGKEYIEPPPFDLNACFEDSSVTTPLIFVLSTGSDPTTAFYNFAESIGMRSKVQGISLGQGQGPKAAALIERAQQEGQWVLLQNCHLAGSWMPELERICESIDPERVSGDFRLWLTSMPSKVFPVSVLQNGVKMTNEPPKGLRQNLKNFFYGLDDESLSVTNNPYAYRKLLFGLSFFHAIVQERKKFGPLGWNKPYEFNTSDLEISQRQLERYLDEYEDIPYRVLNFLTSYINYGGRVTDDKDLRLIDVILKDYFCEEIMEDGYKFSTSGTYYSLPFDDEHPHNSVMEYVSSLPMNADPEVFSMHSNANITCDQNETYELFDTIVSLQPRTAAAAGQSREELIAETSRDIQSRLPEPFDVDTIIMRYPVLYEESMNTVLVQECLRYNRLIQVMRSTLSEIQRALKGLVVMSSELDEMGSAIVAQKIPSLWEARAYPSLKPLGPWVTELLERLHFIQDWVDNGPPAVYWISGFFFPQAFLTGTLQNFARKYQLPIDTIDFGFHVLKSPWTDLTEKPQDGCYVRGLFLEGARWSPDKHVLDDSVPKQLYTSLPPMHLEPIQDREVPKAGVYRCPVYKILSRWGTLSTTGHSSNFVMWIELPSDRGDTINNVELADSDAWIKAGVAAFCSLRY